MSIAKHVGLADSNMEAITEGAVRVPSISLRIDRDGDIALMFRRIRNGIVFSYEPNRDGQDMRSDVGMDPMQAMSMLGGEPRHVDRETVFYDDPEKLIEAVSCLLRNTLENEA